MASNVEVPDAGMILRHLRKHHWQKAEAKAFLARHADLVGVATYGDWEDLGREYLEAHG